MATPQQIVATKLNHEVVLRVPRPASIEASDEVGLLDVAGRKLYLVVVPRNKTYGVVPGSGIKVIAGSVSWKDKTGSVHERSRAIDPFTVVSTIVESKDNSVTAGNEGGIVLLMKDAGAQSSRGPYSDMSQLRAHTIFPGRFPAEVRHMDFPWVQVQDRPWANGKWKGVEFYNIAGFYVRSLDSDENLCHFQFWTAGVNTNAGFHNHIEQTMCEIHVCLANGTGKGGMSWATVDDDQFKPTEPDLSKIDHQVVPSMYEQGPMWRTVADGPPKLRINGTVDYGWHAWISGEGDPKRQSYDVWVVFEFPPLIARVPSVAPKTLKAGRYRVSSLSSQLDVLVQDADSADNTPIILKTPAEKELQQQWDIAKVPGTDLFTLRNVSSLSFATASWPLVSGQSVVGHRSLAVMDITSSWSIEPVSPGVYKIRLIGTQLYWSHPDSGNNSQLTLRDAESDESALLWVFHEVKH
ncbi:hypothetical protein DENSPDRAFT_932507 [Dentipellis sp. KUC8613]|nr:hypothetical protein DENSPDRAFT_932507 [Dentipellis sp. KUC8613]